MVYIFLMTRLPNKYMLLFRVNKNHDKTGKAVRGLKNASLAGTLSAETAF
jgi:hypothetical protein